MASWLKDLSMRGDAPVQRVASLPAQIQASKEKLGACAGMAIKVTFYRTPKGEVYYMDDVYQHAKRQIHQPASPELVAGFKEKMGFIRQRFKHNARAVDSCLSGMADPPTLLEVLTAAFVVNGGVLFKHGDDSCDPRENREEIELNELMQEIQELSQGNADYSRHSKGNEDAVGAPKKGIASLSEQGR